MGINKLTQIGVLLAALACPQPATAPERDPNVRISPETRAALSWVADTARVAAYQLLGSISDIVNLSCGTDAQGNEECSVVEGDERIIQPQYQIVLPNGTEGNFLEPIQVQSEIDQCELNPKARKIKASCAEIVMKLRGFLDAVMQNRRKAAEEAERQEAEELAVKKATARESRRKLREEWGEVFRQAHETGGSIRSAMRRFRRED